MNSYRRLLKALSILTLLIFSFILPSLIVPWIEQVYSLPDFYKELVRNTLAALPTFIGLAAVFLYHNFDGVYVFVNRAWLWLTNSTVSWSLSVEYGDISDGVIDTIYSEILRTYDDAEAVQNHPLEKLINLPRTVGGMVKLKQIESADNEELIYDPSLLLVRIFDLNLPFRKSEETIEELDQLLSNSIENQVRSTSPKYTFRINFEDVNPYFGLFIQKERILAKDIQSFNCGFIDRYGHSEGHIDISKKRLSLVTNSAADFRRLSKRYVSLASPDLSTV